MIDWLILLVLIGEVIVLSKLDKTIFGTWITPFSLLSFPYTVIVMTAFLLAPALGFISLYVESVLIWMVGLLIFWMGGLTIALPLGKTIRGKKKRNQPVLYEKRSEKLALILAWVSIPVIIYHFFISLGLVGGLPGLGTENFASTYGSGLGAHLMVLCMIFLIFFIGRSRKSKKLTNFTIAIIAVLILLRQVKYGVILPLMAGIIYRALSGRFRLSVFNFAFFSFLVYFIFNLAYLIGFWAMNAESSYTIIISTYKTLFRHFCSYLVGGVLVLGELVREGIENVQGDPDAIFAPFINLYGFIYSGDIISRGSGYPSVISIDGTKHSNVITLFGSLLIGLGYFGALVYTLGLGLVSYMSFALAMLTRNCWVVVLWSFVAAMLAIGWFGLYFSLLISIEVPAYCVVFACLFWLFEKNRHKYESFLNIEKPYLDM